MSAICILGMPRSGTSLTANLLHQCGLYLGEEADLLDANKNNSAGYWENKKFIEINNLILQELGGAYQQIPDFEANWEKLPSLNYLKESARQLIQEFEGRKVVWGWKDPRTSLTLRFWLDLYPDLRIIWCVRNPIEVMQSIAKMGFGETEDLGLSLWKTYNKSILSFLPSPQILITHYESYFFDAKAELVRLLDHINLAVDGNTLENAAQNIRPQLHHNQSSAYRIELLEDTEIRDIYKRLCDASGEVYQRLNNSSEYQVKLLRQELHNLYSQQSEELIQQSAAILQNKLSEQLNVILELQKGNLWLESQINNLEQSRKQLNAHNDQLVKELDSLRHAYAEVETAKDWHSEQAQNWQHSYNDLLKLKEITDAKLEASQTNPSRNRILLEQQTENWQQLYQIIQNELAQNKTILEQQIDTIQITLRDALRQNNTTEQQRLQYETLLQQLNQQLAQQNVQLDALAEFHKVITDDPLAWVTNNVSWRTLLLSLYTKMTIRLPSKLLGYHQSNPYEHLNDLKIEPHAPDFKFSPKEIVAAIRGLPQSFYWPIPRNLPEDFWGRQSEMVGIDFKEQQQLELAKTIFPQYAAEYDFPLTADDRTQEYDFYLDNDFFSQFDPAVHYALLRHYKPKRVIEVGSGMSTCLTAQALRRNNNDALFFAIEPYPNPIISKGLPGLTDLLVSPVQDIDFSFFQTLTSGDYLFIDTSHVVVTGGDVVYLYLEVLPRLNPGVIIHIHDILLPGDYLRLHMDNYWFWNEQYLLQAFLIYNQAFEVLFSNALMARNHTGLLRSIFPNVYPQWTHGGVSFWMRRKN